MHISELRQNRIKNAHWFISGIQGAQVIASELYVFSKFRGEHKAPIIRPKLYPDANGLYFD